MSHSVPMAAAERRCGCGHSVESPMIEKEPKYSFVGWCTLLFGISTLPERIAFRCRACRQSLGDTADLAVRRKHM